MANPSACEKLMIFIDGSNLYHGVKDTIGTGTIDLPKLIQFLSKKDFRLVRTYFYTAPVNQFDDVERYKAQQRFFAFLKRIPDFELKLGRLENHPIKLSRDEWVAKVGQECADKFISTFGGSIDDYTEKGVDVQIAVDMLELAFVNAYDTAILVSGDGDFAGLVKSIKRLGKRVEVAYVEGRPAFHLNQECDVFIPLEKKFLQSIKVTPKFPKLFK